MADAQGAIVTLPEKLTIEKAEKLKKQLEKILPSYPSLMLDFRKMNTIDVAGLQLLSAFTIACLNTSTELGCMGPIAKSVRTEFQLSGLLTVRGDHEYLFPFAGNEGVKIEFSG